MRTVPILALGVGGLLALLPAPLGSVPQDRRAAPLCTAALQDSSNPGGPCIAASRIATLGHLYPLGEDLFVDASTGRVGVGLLNPNAALHVRARRDGELALRSVGGRGPTGNAGPGARLVGGSGSIGGTGAIGVGANGELGDGGTGLVGLGGNGFDGFGGDGVRGTAGTGGLGAGFGVFSIGDVGATGVKSFVQPHPLDPSKEIRFVALEGNEAGTYFRGTARTVGGQATIEVPEEFRHVTAEEGVTVQLTPVGALALLAVERTTPTAIHVLGSEDVTFHYLVQGVRRGFEEHEPTRRNRTFVPELRGVPYGAELPAAVRRSLVENGTLREDYTPDEATAARLGWPLRDRP